MIFLLVNGEMYIQSVYYAITNNIIKILIPISRHIHTSHTQLMIPMNIYYIYASIPKKINQWRK